MDDYDSCEGKEEYEHMEPGTVAEIQNTQMQQAPYHIVNQGTRVGDMSMSMSAIGHDFDNVNTPIAPGGYSNITSKNSSN